MTLLCDYFLANSDSVAAAVIDWPSGPSRPSKPRGWRQRTPDLLPTVHAGGIEPVVLMAILKGLLTNTDDGDLIDRNARSSIADRDNGERMVFVTAPALIDALASASVDRLREVADQWALAEEFGGAADATELNRGLGQLAALSRQAQTSATRMYCWLCV